MDQVTDRRRTKREIQLLLRDIRGHLRVIDRTVRQPGRLDRPLRKALHHHAAEARRISSVLATEL